MLQLTACGSEKGHSAIINEKSNSLEKAIKSYSVLSERYIFQDININYPQISGLSNVPTQNSVNRLLMEEALKITENYHSDDDGVSMDVDFVIKQKSERLISVQYIGDVYVENSPHPTNLFYTTTIDLKNGTKIRLGDLVKIDTELVKKFRDGRYIPNGELNLDQEGALTELKEGFTDEELIDMFVAADNIYKSNSSHTFIYFTENSMGISIGTPHVVGDHMEIEIPYENIRSLVRDELGIWQDVFK